MPVEEEKATILIVEDDLDVAEMLNAYFQVQGYEVHTVNWGEDGVRAAQSNAPDIIILDIRLPDIDGFEVARQLRNNRKTKEIPILFLTERRERVDRLRGLELRAEDYITKPFDIQELRLRVRNTLRRAKQGTLTNPVTGLPEGELVEEQLKSWLEDSTPALFVVSLVNLERFKEVYGFVASDDLLRAVGLMLQDLLREAGSGDQFIGHLTLSDFVILAHLESRTAFSERLRRQLQQSFDYFYRDQDRAEGVFREQGLDVAIQELATPAGVPFHTVQQIQSALEKMVRQGGA